MSKIITSTNSFYPLQIFFAINKYKLSNAIKPFKKSVPSKVAQFGVGNYATYQYQFPNVFPKKK